MTNYLFKHKLKQSHAANINKQQRLVDINYRKLQKIA